jgi:predicted GTPase
VTEPNAGGADAQVVQLVANLEPELRGSLHEERLAAIRQRVEGPLRVAIAGRVKAGKSTLLNALVGERLAPTDAGECTRIISYYRRGNGYDVTARLRSNDSRPLAFSRTNGALSISLGDLSERDVAALEIAWPASTLDRMTLIDTPGLASVNDENSRRTREFLEHDADRPADADAVIYLMRHLHKNDVSFLDAFMDRSVTAASPVNAVAVLSRAEVFG